jgi:RNA polymerase sigma-70 factor (ECF subfamily)
MIPKSSRLSTNDRSAGQVAVIGFSDAMTSPPRRADPSAPQDRSRLEELVRVLYPAVWRLCAYLVDEAAAEDLVQETLLRATTALPGFRAEANARTWILAIARHVCMDELRARYRRDRRDTRLRCVRAPAPAGGDPAGEFAARELVAHLSPDRRSAFVLTQLLSLSYAEAAEICDCPLGTIRSRVARAREDLIALAEPGRERQSATGP